jgi:hypothetical protein
VQVRVLTCDKLSHCLFDFDCENLQISGKEVYNYDEFDILNMIFSQSDSPEMTTHDCKYSYDAS